MATGLTASVTRSNDSPPPTDSSFLKSTATRGLAERRSWVTGQARRAADRVESNGVKVVLVERADRLARDLMVNEVIVHQLSRAGARVLTADGADLTSADGDPTRTLIRQVLGAVAQFEKSVLVLKLRAARDRKRRRDGKCEGRKPFGDRPAEAQALERIRALRRKPKGRVRLSIAAIAATLNAEQVPTRSGRPWAPGTVHGILRRISVAPYEASGWE